MLEPPTGQWKLTELTGEIHSQSGGAPVLCIQGSLSRRPVPIYDESAVGRSSIELRHGAAFYFQLAFEDGNDFVVVTNKPDHRPPNSLSQVLGHGDVRTAGKWSWDERNLDGIIESVADDGSGSGAAQFEVSGTFLSPTEIAGEWSYEERSARASCWSRSRGRGSWRSAAPIGG